MSPPEGVRIRIIQPYAHRLFIEGRRTPAFTHCTGPDCWICKQVGMAKSMKEQPGPLDWMPPK
jgi:hypothetical protein